MGKSFLDLNRLPNSGITLTILISGTLETDRCTRLGGFWQIRQILTPPEKNTKTIADAHPCEKKGFKWKNMLLLRKHVKAHFEHHFESYFFDRESHTPFRTWHSSRLMQLKNSIISSPIYGCAESPLRHLWTKLRSAYELRQNKTKFSFP